MPRSKAIPDNLHPDLLKRAGEGRGGPALSEWLMAEHGLKVSARAVQRLLKEIAADRAPIAQAVVREKLAGTLTADLDAVTGLLSRALSIENEARTLGEADIALRAQDRQLKALDLRFKLSGAIDGPTDRNQSGIILLPEEKD